MTDKEIREKLREFIDLVFDMDVSEAYEIKNMLNAFCKENNVTIAQMDEFAASGAGEMLYLLTY